MPTLAAVRRSLSLARSLAVYHGIPLRQRRLRRLYRTFAGPADLVFDLGAHVGTRPPARAPASQEHLFDEATHEAVVLVRCAQSCGGEPGCAPLARLSTTSTHTRSPATSASAAHTHLAR